MRRFAPVLALAAAVMLAGCLQSKVPLYREKTPLEPFRTGKVEGVNGDNKSREPSVLTKETGGVYRLTNDEKGGSDFGDSFSVRFFALPGAPAGIVIYEAQEHKNCKPADNMCSQDPMYYYGLARVGRDSAEVVNPDCDKDGDIAKLPGVTVGDYGSCTFADRAVLERALAMESRKPWKAQVTYRFTDEAK